MELNLQRMARNLELAFPEIAPVGQLYLLGAGFRNLALESSTGIIFRIARNQQASEGHMRERYILPLLSMNLPEGIQIPSPRFYAPPSDLFPFGVVGHIKVDGRSLNVEQLSQAQISLLAQHLASFLIALQGLDPDRLDVSDLRHSPYSDKKALSVMRDTVLPALQLALNTVEFSRIAQWWDKFMSNTAMGNFRPVIQHGDLWYDHILVSNDASQVTGIIDFESCAIGDPAQDFATLLYSGVPFTAEVIAACHRAGRTFDRAFFHRLRGLWELREFDGLQAAIAEVDPEEIADAIEKLRHGPILNSFG